MTKRWILNQVTPATIASVAAATGLSPVAARILAGRGLTELDQAAAFLAPRLADMLDPFLLAGMDEAVARLVAAREAGEQVCIYGDYDVDGISATALLVSGFTALGLKTGYHIPNRMEDGYGLNRDALALIRQQGSGLVVSVDCGVTAVDEARFCREIGLDLIITDHHQPLPDLPDAVAVINPHRPDCSYPFKGLAGVGVAFQLLVALRSRLREGGVLGNNGPDLRQWLDLVALGTIADLVPLTGQNRLLVAAGLQRMGDGCRIGLAALKQVAGVKGTVSSGQVSFQLAPRLNAAGRLESAVPGVELLLSNDLAQAATLAAELDAANTERRQVELQIFEQADNMLVAQGWTPDRCSIVLWSPDWHQGVVGIVSSRLVERYYRPTILLAALEDGTAKGSGRSIIGFHLLNALHGCAGHLLRYGGHRVAAGVTIKQASLEQFKDDFEQAATAALTPEQLVPELLLDAELNPADLQPGLVHELQQLAPFGMANPEPVLLLRQCQVSAIRTFGDNHLKFTVRLGKVDCQVVGWRMADQADLPAVVDLACVPELNSWGGEERLQLRLKAVRPAEAVTCAAG